MVTKTEDNSEMMKRVNTINSHCKFDEDCIVQSDVGNKMANMKRNQPAKTLLSTDPDLRRWYDNLARGSQLTADVRLRRLVHFCKKHDTTPLDLAKLAQSNIRDVTDLIEDHVTWMEEQQFSPGYVEDTIKSVKSWLRHFEVEIKRRIKISNIDSTPTLQNERVPNEEEISEMLNRTSLRESVIISLIAKSGLRPQVIGNYNGTDGLKIGDLPDLVIEEKEARFLQEPPRVVVRRTISKARHQYFTFLTSSATRKVLAYLNDRISRGEKLSRDSSLVSPETRYRYGRGKNADKKYLPTQRISHLVRKVFRPRFSWRPYVLRAYFDTQLLMAESRGKIAHDFRTFFMGHKGTIEARYTTNKGIIPETLLREMQNAFKRSEEFLDLDLVITEREKVKTDDIINNVIQNATAADLANMQKLLQSWANEILSRR
ncbi:MAG: hypothetical protein ACT4N5_05465 [Nitrosopumilaceae archaeon]